MAGAILLVGGAAIAFILTSGPDGSRPDAPEPSPGAPPPPLSIPIGPLPGVAAGGSITLQEAGPVVEFDAAPAPPDPGSWEAVPAAARPGRMGPIGPVMTNELNELQPRLAACFDEEAQSRYGQVPVSRYLETRTQDENAATLLVLNLELQPGQVRIADAPVESQGGASDGLVACAQQVLRGHVIRTPVSRTSGRARMILPLRP